MSTPKRPKRPADFNQRAFQVFQEAIGETPPESAKPDSTHEPPEHEKNPHAVALGKLGGSKGGKKRAKNLTAEQRREIARKAAKSRWAKEKGNI